MERGHVGMAALTDTAVMIARAPGPQTSYQAGLLAL